MAAIVSIYHPMSDKGWVSDPINGEGIMDDIVNVLCRKQNHTFFMPVSGSQTHFPKSLLKQCVITVYEDEPAKK